MSSRNRSDVKKLFEFWAEVTRAHGVDRSTSTGAAAPAGIILESFPECYRDEKTIADIPDFAFPCDFLCDSVQSYSFVLTTDDSKWRYGFCRHDPKTDSAMVIVTYLPWHDVFLRMLSVLAELRRSSNEEFRTFISDVYNRGMPDPGGSVTVFYSGSQSPFVFERPLQFQLPSIPENQMLSLYYNFVDPKNMIAIFAAMLAERRIIFTSRRLDRLSSCIQAANAFLYPMVWQHIFIPVLPMKLKDYLCAPMPYLIGVPEMVLNMMTPEELGEVVILYCDRKIVESPFDDVHEMPAEIVSQLKKQLSHTHEHLGDRVSKIFLGALVQLIGGYRDAVEFRDTGKSFNRDKFIETRPPNLRPFLAKMMELQIFQQFIDERIEMLNTGLGFSDEFEKETVRYAEKMKKRGRNYAFLKNVKDKTNPAVKSAVKSVKEGSRGVKTAYKDLKSKLRDITPPSSSSSHFRSHLSATNSQHDRIDGFIVVGGGGKLPVGGHHSAPSSPIFNNRTYQHSVGFQYSASPADSTVSKKPSIRKPPPLASSNSTSHIQPNGYANCISASVTNTPSGGHLTMSPTDSPASSLCSSEMNLSQELQNHPLFKSPIVDRSLKPNSGGSELSVRIKAGRMGVGVPPPIQQVPSSSRVHLQKSVIQRPPEASPYHNHRYIVAQQQQHQHKLEQQQDRLLQPTAKSHPHTSISSTYAQTHPPVANKSSLVPRPALNKSSNIVHTSGVSTRSNKIITTGSIFDNPPDMLSPPVPPRRSGLVEAGGSVGGLGINNPRNNCRNINGIHRTLSGKQPDIEPCNSSCSNTSVSSSSSASFVSVAPAFSHQQQPLHTCRKETLLPVPAPRLKKESLRSLQPYHVPPSTQSGNLQENSEASPSLVSHKDSVNDLISLDDSTNSSFDLEDFDPLNQNARPLPSLVGAGSGSGVSKKTIITSVSTSSTISNPLYPYYTPQHTPLLPPTIKPPPPPTGVTPYDDDFELLRKYGLDQFSLSPNIAATTAHSSKTFKNNTSSTSNIILQSATQSNKSMNNWTTFD